MALIKVGKSIRNINEQADRLISLSEGNEARIRRINEVRERYLKNIRMTAYNRKWEAEAEEYSKHRDLNSKHMFFETKRRIETYCYGFTQYSHIQTKTRRQRRKSVKSVTAKETDEIVRQIHEDGHEVLGREGLLEMRAVVKRFTKEMNNLRRERSKLNKENRSVSYANMKLQKIANGEIKEY